MCVYIYIYIYIERERDSFIDQSIDRYIDIVSSGGPASGPPGRGAAPPNNDNVCIYMYIYIYIYMCRERDVYNYIYL